jgi:PEP-CTERM motif-containing protein
MSLLVRAQDDKMMLKSEAALKIRAVWLVASLIACATPAFATSITVGNDSGGAFVRPFGCGAAGCLGESQQVYAATAFSGPITITQIAFKSGTSGPTPAGLLSTTFTLSLGTTTATPSSLDTNYALNRGPDFTSVFAGTVNDAAVNSGTFDFIINLSSPFNYNPANGNLLLDVNTLSVLIDGSTTKLVGFLAGASSDTGWVYDFFNGPNPPISSPNFGLLTQFTGSAATAAVPEPSTITLLLMGLAFRARHRLRK